MEDNHSTSSSSAKVDSPRSDASLYSHQTPSFDEERRKVLHETKLERALQSPVLSETSVASTHHTGHKFHEVFQIKQGRYVDLPATKLYEMMKSNNLDPLLLQNAPTQSLLSVVNGILDESVERKNGEIPHRVACLLRKVVQEIERRISTQAEHLRIQNNLFKVREEKYQSRIRVLETLASGSNEESELVVNQLQWMKNEKTKMEERKKTEDEDVIRLIKEKEASNQEISSLKNDLEITKKEYRHLCIEMEKYIKGAKTELQDGNEKTKMEEKKKIEDENVLTLINEKEASNLEISTLKKDLKITKQEYKQLCLEMEKHTKGAKAEFQDKNEKTKMEEKKKTEDEDVKRLIEEKVATNQEISSLKKDLEITKKEYMQLCLEMVTRKKTEDENVIRLIKEKDASNQEISSLKKNVEITTMKYKQRCLEMEKDMKGAKTELQNRIKELEHLLEASMNKVKELELEYESKCQGWNKKELTYQSFMNIQFGALQDLRSSSEFIKEEITSGKRSYFDDMRHLGIKLKALANVAENYNVVLVENKALFKELQDLKGNIRVYCRIRPFFPDQREKQTIVEYIGENGELIIANPSKQGKEGNRAFRFNKIYGSTATQVEVYVDIQPLIQSVLDGYNVCIFAYGQTGSGKTYTMNGPNGATEEELGVNYRALNDLFKTSQKRSSLISYEIGIQMVEIYNELVRDLLSKDSSQKKLGIVSNTSNGLAVPDASMHTVKSPSDVMELMDVGFRNRSVSSTALNESSSRSHSVVTIRVRGVDLKTGVASHSNLHLVDLAGSERVDRSEVTGDRLKEAAYINKSLSALGDVIFALAQKNPHVPYRNSKLTQVLQSSLGGQAKTLMFVQLNPEGSSYSESFSTLKFAERVSGIELGAARSSKEGRDVKELMDQVSSLKSTISKQDDEIERLQLLKDIKNGYPANESSSPNSLRHEASASVHPDDEILGSSDADYEERLSEISDGNNSVETEGSSSTRNAISRDGKKSEGMDRTKMASKISRPTQKPRLTAQTTSSLAKGTLKVSPSIKKSHSGSSLSSPGKPPSRKLPLEKLSR